MSDNDHKDLKFWVGFFIGGLLGAIILFFLGTKEGKKTKKLLSDQGKNFFDELRDRLDELEKRGADILEKGEAIKDGLVKEVEEKKEVLTQDVSDKIEDTLAHIEALQERGRETTANLRKRLFKNLPKKS